MLTWESVGTDSIESHSKGSHISVHMWQKHKERLKETSQYIQFKKGDNKRTFLLKLNMRRV